jgi:NADH-quinone oxidoreductase subunit L
VLGRAGAELTAGVATAIGLLFLVGAAGKSAQVPLYVWLPDAMEGPTPVSALLHAATMVAAGVYLIVRAYPIFQAAPDVMLAMSLIGGFTALFAALIAIQQTDIKRVLAYSTCSQLGYMVAALGAGGLFGGYFHLATHAFFKAMLFLSAGSVIHAVHSNEISHMGGLSRKMKLTTFTFITGSAALAGLPGLAGFFSKDQILEALLEATEHNALYWAPFLMCLATVGITAYYMSRVVFLVFFGEPSDHAHHASEGGIAMWAPLLILSVPSIAAGYFGGAFLRLTGIAGEFHVTHVTAVGGVALGLAFGGIGLGYALHVLKLGAGLGSALKPVGDFIEYGAVDRAWLGAYRYGMLSLSRVFAWTDRYIIDGLLNAIGAGVLSIAEWVRGLQTGRVSDYVYVVMIGVVCLAAWSQLVSLAGGVQ